MAYLILKSSEHRGNNTDVYPCVIGYIYNIYNTGGQGVG